MYISDVPVSGHYVTELCGASIALSWALSRRDCRVVKNIAHVDEGVRHSRATRPRSWGSRTTELGWGVSKLIIRLDYNNLYLEYLYKCEV